MRAFPRIQGVATEEPCAVKVDVCHEKLHGTSLGNFPGFAQIFLRATLALGCLRLLAAQLVRRSFSEGAPGPGEEGAWNVVPSCRRGGGQPALPKVICHAARSGAARSRSQYRKPCSE